MAERDETGWYAEGLALYATGQIASAIATLELALSIAQRYDNSSFQSQIVMLLRRCTDS